MRTSRYQFHCYSDDGSFLGVHVEDYVSESAARNAAGRQAKQDNGPCDLAHNGDEPWEERYITTASPSEYHATGYRFERLTN